MAQDVDEVDEIHPNAKEDEEIPSSHPRPTSWAGTSSPKEATASSKVVKPKSLPRPISPSPMRNRPPLLVPAASKLGKASGGVTPKPASKGATVKPQTKGKAESSKAKAGAEAGKKIEVKRVQKTKDPVGPVVHGKPVEAMTPHDETDEAKDRQKDRGLDQAKVQDARMETEKGSNLDESENVHKLEDDVDKAREQSRDRNANFQPEIKATKSGSAPKAKVSTRLSRDSPSEVSTQEIRTKSAGNAKTKSRTTSLSSAGSNETRSSKGRYTVEVVIPIKKARSGSDASDSRKSEPRGVKAAKSAKVTKRAAEGDRVPQKPSKMKGAKKEIAKAVKKGTTKSSKKAEDEEMLETQDQLDINMQEVS
ncbi:hypothetical protein BD324DRAFT_425839 [Kockovaella imperatae]|uniref:Uncharacterized protein n=1 Tax=Kockovaella imperatae TaxID=4999 RepID=A0A1Y1UJ21_9TREE|nr:hypothetical protein BD324DRAFT_425839 [Kockovaella imperatae]ORX37105.1 hypothetical protein BD324DRAFT_425839 [Kockovaella imperatae]